MEEIAFILVKAFVVTIEGLHLKKFLVCSSSGGNILRKATQMHEDIIKETLLERSSINEEVTHGREKFF